MTVECIEFIAIFLYNFFTSFNLPVEKMILEDSSSRQTGSVSLTKKSKYNKPKSKKTKSTYFIGIYTSLRGTELPHITWNIVRKRTRAYNFSFTAFSGRIKPSWKTEGQSRRKFLKTRQSRCFVQPMLPKTVTNPKRKRCCRILRYPTLLPIQARPLTNSWTRKIIQKT